MKLPQKRQRMEARVIGKRQYPKTQTLWKKDLRMCVRVGDET